VLGGEAGVAVAVDQDDGELPPGVEFAEEVDDSLDAGAGVDEQAQGACRGQQLGGGAPADEGGGVADQG
jgi:hypothetical protein